MRKNWLLSVLTLAVCGVLLTGGCVSAARRTTARWHSSVQADGLLALLLVALSYRQWQGDYPAPSSVSLLPTTTSVSS